MYKVCMQVFLCILGIKKDRVKKYKVKNGKKYMATREAPKENRGEDGCKLKLLIKIRGDKFLAVVQ